jgi:hypothetical protein
MKFFAGLEPDGFSRGDAHLGASPRVSADACFARADTEHAKSAQFDALAGRKGLLQAFKDRVYRGFCLGAGQACALDHVMYDVLLNQWSNLAAML